jgi:hypothetical protein
MACRAAWDLRRRVGAFNAVHALFIPQRREARGHLAGLGFRGFQIFHSAHTAKQMWHLHTLTMSVVGGAVVGFIILNLTVELAVCKGHFYSVNT